MIGLKDGSPIICFLLSVRGRSMYGTSNEFAACIRCLGA